MLKICLNFSGQVESLKKKQDLAQIIIKNHEITGFLIYSDSLDLFCVKLNPTLGIFAILAKLIC